MLGGLTVQGAKRKITHFRTRKSASLLAYLAVRLTPQPREVLVDMFWPDTDPEAGRHNLSNALSSLRLVLEPVGVISGSVIEADRFNVGLNPRSVATDALEFEETVTGLLAQTNHPPEHVRDLEAALSLYQGPLLPGFYDDWVNPESARFDSLYKQGIVLLTDQFLAEGHFEKAAHWGQQGLKNDPLDEGSILVLMTALEKLGRHSGALRAYRAFCEATKREALGTPSKKIQSLALAIEAEAKAPEMAMPASEADLAIRRLEIEREALPTRKAPESGPPGRILEAPDSSSLPQDKPRLIGDEFLLRTMTRFFGRRDEITKLAKMLLVPRTRLVTITGPGGIGKTRFALEAIAEIAEGEHGDRDPFTATFVSLGDVSEPAKIFDRIVNALGGILQEGEHSREAAVRVLASQPNPILILDNFEQLLDDGAAMVRSLLARSSQLRVIITSRQRLSVDGEKVFTLTPLAMPDGPVSLPELTNFPSVGLFIDRAEASSVDFEVNEGNVGLVCRICATLEGIPLAIELAAARVSLMSEAHILSEVERNRLDFLITSLHGVAPRHQTIRATLAWSFGLLKEDAKRLLCALSVFRGGWTIEAAQAVFGADRSLIESILTDLRDCSLITVTDNEDGLRFSMSEVIREFASEQGAKGGEREEYARRHANFFVEFAEGVVPGFLSSEGLRTLCRFSVEHPNLLAARGWSDANRDDPIHRKLGMALIRLWLSVNVEHVARRLGESTGTGNHHSMLGLLIPLGGPMDLYADPDEVSGYVQQLVDLFAQRGATEETGWNLVQLGYMNLGRDLTFAREAGERGVALMRQGSSRITLAHAVNALAIIISIQGDYDQAQLLNRESYGLLGEDRESKTYDFAVHTEGVIAFMAGDHARSEECLLHNLAYARLTSDPRSEFAALYIMGRVYNEMGRFAESVEILTNAAAIFSGTQGQISYLSGYLFCYLGYSHYKLGDVREAVRLFRHSLALFKESKRTQGFSMALFFLADLLRSQRQFPLATQIYGASEMFRIKHGRALDRKESEWDADLRSELQHNLTTKFEDEFDFGFGLSEEQAFGLATRGLQACV